MNSFFVILPEHKNEFCKTNLFHFKVNTKRERRASNNKYPIDNDTLTKQFSSLGALVTGLTSPTATMSDEINQSGTLIEINNSHTNGNHSPSKKVSVKNGNEIL